jgi:hypothetical protein
LQPDSNSSRCPGSWASGMKVSRCTRSVLADIASHLIVAAAILVLVAQPPVKLHRHVALLRRRLLVVGQHGVDDSVKQA